MAEPNATEPSDSGGERRRRIGEMQDDGGVVRQEEIAAVVLAVDDGPHAAPRHLGRRVYVRDEADGRDAAFRGRSGNCRHHVAEGVDVSVRETEVAQLAGERAEQDELLIGTWIGRRSFVRLCVAGGVAQESVKNGGHLIADC